MWLQIHDPPIESVRSVPVHRCQCLVIVPISDLVVAAFLMEFWWTACNFLFLLFFLGGALFWNSTSEVPQNDWGVSWGNFPKVWVWRFLKVSEGSPGSWPTTQCGVIERQLRIFPKPSKLPNSFHMRCWHRTSVDPHRFNGKGSAHTSAACSDTRSIYSAKIRSRHRIGKSSVVSNEWLFLVCVVFLPNLAVPLRSEIRKTPANSRVHHHHNVTSISSVYILKRCLNFGWSSWTGLNAKMLRCDWLTRHFSLSAIEKV